MEPITHALTSLALSRALRKRLPRFGTPMLVISGVAADLDFVSYFGGAAAFLRFHRALLHSALGSAATCCFIAAVSCFVDRGCAEGGSGKARAPLTFFPAFAVCAAGAAAHMILDLASGIGVRLWWPFREGWQSWDLLANLDVWIVLLLATALLTPLLSVLVSEEIGEHKAGAPGGFAAAVTVFLLALYIGARARLHSRAIDLLVSREYHGEPPQKAGAFPSSSNPFAWRGLVSTSNAIAEINISLLRGATFDPERAVSHYKPEASPTVAAAQSTSSAKLFLRYARFPLARIESQDADFDLTLRDLRFQATDSSLDNIEAELRLNANSQVVEQRMRFVTQARQRPR